MQREIVEKWLADKRARRAQRGDDQRSQSDRSLSTQSYRNGTKPGLRFGPAKRLVQINEDDAESSHDSRADGRRKFDFRDDIELRIDRKENGADDIDILALT